MDSELLEAMNPDEQEAAVKRSGALVIRSAGRTWLDEACEALHDSLVVLARTRPGRGDYKAKLHQVDTISAAILRSGSDLPADSLLMAANVSKAEYKNLLVSRGYLKPGELRRRDIVSRSSEALAGPTRYDAVGRRIDSSGDDIQTIVRRSLRLRPR